MVGTIYSQFNVVIRDIFNAYILRADQMDQTYIVGLNIDVSNFLELYISVKNIALQWFGIVIIFIITSFELLCIAIK